MAENLRVLDRLSGKADPKPGLGHEIDKMMNMAAAHRRKFERRWFDNNFFDDGYHFRYVSRTTGKIVDLTTRNVGNQPVRAIPKASRQIRGIANLLMAQDPHPTVFPKRVLRSNYPTPKLWEQAQEVAQEIALRQGDYLKNEWEEQELSDKLVQMIILAAKNSVSYLQVYPDAVNECIKTKVRDAFDVYLLGNYTDIQEVPFIILATPKLLSRIEANEIFDKDQVEKLIADNKYAHSEVKQAYQQNRFGAGQDTEEGETVMLKEMYKREYINKDNLEEIAQSNPKVLQGKKVGDVVMRHTFSAGGTWLKDEYLDMEKYPFVDFRFEPGPIYQTSLIERFIPQNKSLDLVVSRIERFLNTMVSGKWLVRAGEDINITNIPGGEKITYKGTPPVQADIASLPPAIFKFLEMMEKYIEEQGASTAALGQLPSGVKSGVAIESLKATEYANLKIATKQLQKSVKRISEQMLDIVADYYIRPQEVAIMGQGQPTYFDIIGERGAQLRQEMGEGLPEDTIVIKKGARVDVEVETELAYTRQGKREVMQQIIEFMTQMAEMGYINQNAVKVVMEKFLDTFKFGATGEFMEALDEEALANLTDDELMKIKIAVVEAMRDAGVAGVEQEQKQVDATKVGMMEAIKDLEEQGGQNAAS